MSFWGRLICKAPRWLLDSGDRASWPKALGVSPTSPPSWDGLPVCTPEGSRDGCEQATGELTQEASRAPKAWENAPSLHVSGRGVRETGGSQH